MDPKPYVHVPQTVSAEAQAFLRAMPDPHLKPQFPAPDDLERWKKLQGWADADGIAKSEPVVRALGQDVRALTLGVPGLDIRPKAWTDTGKVMVYTHGGAHVMYSAASMLGRAALAAHEIGLRIISVDYTLSPQIRFNEMSDQTVAAIRGLVASGQNLSDMAIFGNTSGGGLAAATVLKMRDLGLGMPAVAVLVSPWLDVTDAGDTETTLYDADPNQLYEKHTRFAAAFADLNDQKHPYASPVYGDFSKGFPPTLIQGALKEVLLSGFVRFCQALDQAGIPVKLDLYEGMVHNFQDRIPNAPEAITARGKMRDFLHRHLGLTG